eukprot:COSAG02_NODE_41265_length_396_cov_0.969697_1_plen_54_part_01
MFSCLLDSAGARPLRACVAAWSIRTPHATGRRARALYLALALVLMYAGHLRALM